MIPGMAGLLRNGVLGVGLLALGSLAAVSQPAPRADPAGGATIMSDTLEWCTHLSEQVEALRQSLTGAHPDADMLAQEGRRMCGNGHVRQGIIRLRYALMRLRTN